MKTYDMNKVIRTIQMKSDILVSASLGIAEDWYWTAETVYADGRFIVELMQGMKFGGIGGSNWATPAVQLVYKDGTEEMVDCYIDDVADGNRSEYFELGPMSGPAQEYIDALRAAPKTKAKRKLKIT